MLLTITIVRLLICLLLLVESYEKLISATDGSLSTGTASLARKRPPVVECAVHQQTFYIESE